MGQPLLQTKPARRGHPPVARQTVRPFRRRRRPGRAPGQLLLAFRAEGSREHPLGTCTWCGGEPVAYSAAGDGWCLAHSPDGLL